MNIIVTVILFCGLFFFAGGAVGIIRFPDFYFAPTLKFRKSNIEFLNILSNFVRLESDTYCKTEDIITYLWHYIYFITLAPVLASHRGNM